MDAHKDEHGHHEGGHHVPPAWIFHAVFAALLVLTVITYYASTVHLGRAINITVALAIACVKASLVCAFFMHLVWDKRFNTVVLLVSLGALTLFLGMTTLDTSENEWRKDPTYAEAKMQLKRQQLGIKYHPKHDLEKPGEQQPGGIDLEKAKPLAQWAYSTFGPLPRVAESQTNPVTDAKVKLGQMLYFDPRISRNHDVSCSTCHDLGKFGIDGRPTSIGHRGQQGTRNSPSVLNAALQTIGQFWDARAADAEEVAGAHVLNPVEMAMPSEAEVVGVLRSIPGYEPLFAAAFPGPEAGGQGNGITFENMKKAIGAFERKLMTRGRFDAFMEGNYERLTPQEMKGLETFRDVGCTTCHSGKVLGGTSLEKLGKLKPYPTKDRGVFEDSGKPRDMFMFKVPQLRNVTKTGPYLHDGSIASLDEMIRLMGTYQLGRELSDEQVADIVAFLGALEGELDPALAAKPPLPESGPSTPKPNPN